MNHFKLLQLMTCVRNTVHINYANRLMKFVNYYRYSARFQLSKFFTFFKQRNVNNEWENKEAQLFNAILICHCKAYDILMFFFSLECDSKSAFQLDASCDAKHRAFHKKIITQFPCPVDITSRDFAPLNIGEGTRTFGSRRKSVACQWPHGEILVTALVSFPLSPLATNLVLRTYISRLAFPVSLWPSSTRTGSQELEFSRLFSRICIPTNI